MTSIRAHIAMLAFVIILGPSNSARAAGFDITEFYTGKTITFIVGLENTSYARTMGRRKNGVPCAAAPWKVSWFTEFLLPHGYFNTKYERIDCNLT